MADANLAGSGWQPATVERCYHGNCAQPGCLLNAWPFIMGLSLVLPEHASNMCHTCVARFAATGLRLGQQGSAVFGTRGIVSRVVLSDSASLHNAHLQEYCSG